MFRLTMWAVIDISVCTMAAFWRHPCAKAVTQLLVPTILLPYTTSLPRAWMRPYCYEIANVSLIIIRPKYYVTPQSVFLFHTTMKQK